MIRIEVRPGKDKGTTLLHVTDGFHHVEQVVADKFPIGDAMELAAQAFYRFAVSQKVSEFLGK